MPEVRNPRVVNTSRGKRLQFEVPTGVHSEAASKIEKHVPDEYVRVPANGGTWEMEISIDAFDAVEGYTPLDLPREYLYPEVSEVVMRIQEGEMWIEIEEYTDEVLEKIRDEFSYDEEWYDQRNNKYRTREKDLLVQPNEDGNPMLPIGLRQQMEEMFDEIDVQYTFIDERREPEWGKIDVDWNFDYDLREYQKYALSRCLRGSCVVQWPTGAGKTILALRLIYEMGLPTIILVNRKELLKQWEDEIQKVLGIKPGVIQGERYEIRDVTVAMIQTLTEKEGKIDDFDNFITDEVHHIQADTWYDIALRVNAYYRFGLSATADEGLRDDDKGIKIIGGIGPNDIKLSPERLIEKGQLAEPNFKWLYPKRVRIQSEDWHEVYETAIVDNDDRNKLIVDEAEKQLENGRRILIDVDRINHGQNILEMFDQGLQREWWPVADLAREGAPRGMSLPFDPASVMTDEVPVVHNGEKIYGYGQFGGMPDAIDMALDNEEITHPVMWVYGEDDDAIRNYILDSFKRGDIECIVSTLLGEGVNIPTMNTVVLASGGKSSINLIQTIGRSLRPENGKALIVDLKDQGRMVSRHFSERVKTMRSYYGKYFNNEPV